MDTDALYGKSNTTMSDWSKSNGLVTARYPAGMASYWNWEDPSGTMGQSSLGLSSKGIFIFKKSSISWFRLFTYTIKLLKIDTLPGQYSI